LSITEIRDPAICRLGAGMNRKSKAAADVLSRWRPLGLRHGGQRHNRPPTQTTRRPVLHENVVLVHSLDPCTSADRQQSFATLEGRRIAALAWWPARPLGAGPGTCHRAKSQWNLGAWRLLPHQSRWTIIGRENAGRCIGRIWTAFAGCRRSLMRQHHPVWRQSVAAVSK